MAETAGMGSRAWLLPATAGALLLIANGRNSVPLAAWLAPFFLLRFTRGGRARVRLPAAFSMLFISWLFQFRGMVPAPRPILIAVAATYSLALLVPYLVDRALTPKLPAAWATLVFPAAWAGTEYLMTLASPYGSWGAMAYSQFSDLPLMQLVSVTGLAGVTFLMGWFASAMNLAWAHGRSWRRARKPVALFAATLAAVLMGGGIRVAFFPPDAPTVRVASMNRRDVGSAPSKDLERRLLRNQPLTDVEVGLLRDNGRTGTDDLLARTSRAADAGANIIFWNETAGDVFKEDEPALIAQAQQLASRKQIYLGLALGAWQRGARKPLENKLVLIAPDGRIAYEYWKARPVPGDEKNLTSQLDGNIKTVLTPHGRLGSAICFDLDFPQLLAQAGRLGTDVLLAPSNDWRDIDPWHTHMATFRAVEQGFNLVRQTRSGLSMAVDYQGRALAQMDDFGSPDREMTAYVPTRGVRTVYSRIGDAFAWGCLFGLAMLLFAIRNRS
ncbi:nitrilase-related carbon-nitrogen hydrolase [Geothrix fuzhouensis]|uniref:nitrilase-related carbon-nitrogen hydrolase n=1 Tax=Geothrix fuzhouensis TaxID=2966451 RepID=UPI00214732F4|nr:nitrilase-related carbon-nitrogen hydrolase [Geothrix fuzhouensis]